MLHIAICDDHAGELDGIAQLVEEYQAERNLPCAHFDFSSGFELVSALEKGRRFDVYCLDILMPGVSGIDAAREIRSFDRTAPILFFTSSPEYALESYGVKAASYVLKPISREKLFSALDDALERIGLQEREDAIVVKSTEGLQRILLRNLSYVEAMGRHVLYHLFSGRTIACAEPFSAVCGRLLPYGCFVKPHRSYLVNMQHVEAIDQRQLTLQNRAVIPVAQGKAREVRQRYLDFQMGGE